MTSMTCLVAGAGCWLGALYLPVGFHLCSKIDPLDQLHDMAASGQHSGRAKAEAMSLVRPRPHVSLCWSKQITRPELRGGEIRLYLF